MCNKLKFNLVNYRYIRNSLPTVAYLNDNFPPLVLYQSLTVTESLYKDCLKIYDKKHVLVITVIYGSNMS